MTRKSSLSRVTRSKISWSRRQSLLSDFLEALVDSPIPGKIENFEIAIWCVRYIWCNWYLGSKGHAVPWRTLDTALGSAAAFNAVSGRMRKYLALAVFPSCNQNIVSVRTQYFTFLLDFSLRLPISCLKIPDDSTLSILDSCCLLCDGSREY